MPLFSRSQKPPSDTHNLDKDDIELAINEGVERYFAGRKAAVPEFVNTHFRYPGCWRTNRSAFGLDLLRAPLNLIWAPFYVMLVIILLILGLLGVKNAAHVAQKLPGGLVTRVQRHVNEQIQQKLLDREALKLELTASLSALADIPENNPRHHGIAEELNKIVEQALAQLMLTRTASADITNTLFSTAIGALLFKKFTPGGFGIGLLLAAYWAKENAKSSFFLGSTLGSWYYAVFPPKADVIEQAAGIGIAMMLLSIFASFSGLITDPMQSWLGLHQRRLRRMLDHLHRDLLTKSSSRYKPLDPYVARILELFDTLKAQVSL